MDAQERMAKAREALQAKRQQKKAERELPPPKADPVEQPPKGPQERPLTFSDSDSDAVEEEEIPPPPPKKRPRQKHLEIKPFVEEPDEFSHVHFIGRRKKPKKESATPEPPTPKTSSFMGSITDTVAPFVGNLILLGASFAIPVVLQNIAPRPVHIPVQQRREEPYAERPTPRDDRRVPSIFE